MQQILFVCLGNICRSPMAEFIMKDLLLKEGLQDRFCVVSAGTSGEHNGENMHEKTRAKLKEKNIACDFFVSKKLSKELCENSAYIFVMDDANLRDLQRAFKGFELKTQKITKFSPELSYENVPDPWYSGDFEETYQILSLACANVLKRLKNS